MNPTNLTAREARVVREAARPMLRSAVRKGLLAGIAIGATALCIVLWLLGAGGRP